MLIGQLADTLGVVPETIRFYERRGLLPEPRRARNGYRVYDESTLGRAMGGKLSTAGAAALLGAILALAGLTSVLGASSKKTNEMPVANAGFDQTVSLGEIVVLDGSASTDVDGGRLRFSWQLASVPAGSSWHARGIK